MSHAAAPAEISLKPAEGWHCSHLYYRFDRARLAGLTAAELGKGAEQFRAALDPAGEGAPARLQSSVVSGHKADFGLMILDADPLLNIRNTRSIHGVMLRGRWLDRAELDAILRRVERSAQAGCRVLLAN